MAAELSLEKEYKGVEVKWYGIVILRTRRFLALMDRLGKRRIAKPLAWVLLYIMPVAAGFALFLEFVQLSVYLSPQGGAVIQYVRSLTPTVNLLLPGINPYVPIIYGWLALIVALVVHEGAHGVVARSLGMPVKSSGLLFFLIFPIGAFVEVDEKVLKVARARDSTRVLAAGAGVNFVLAVVCVVLVFNIASTMTPAANGGAVISISAYQNSTQTYSPAYLAGIRPGDYIISMNNVPFYAAINDSGIYKPGNKVNFTIWRNGETLQKPNVVLGNVTEQDVRTGKNFSRAFIGVLTMSPVGLQQRVNAYLGAFAKSPRPYICIPTLPLCQDFVPYSDEFIGFYKSPLGGLLPVVLNLLFWMYFINFNLAIFNSLPIYPLDGGQAFDVTVKALGKGRLTETALNRITTTVSVVLVSMIAILFLGPYLFF